MRPRRYGWLLLSCCREYITMIFYVKTWHSRSYILWYHTRYIPFISPTQIYVRMFDYIMLLQKYTHPARDTWSLGTQTHWIPRFLCRVFLLMGNLTVVTHPMKCFYWSSPTVTFEYSVVWYYQVSFKRILEPILCPNSETIIHHITWPFPHDM